MAFLLVDGWVLLGMSITLKDSEIDCCDQGWVLGLWEISSEENAGKIGYLDDCVGVGVSG